MWTTIRGEHTPPRFNLVRWFSLSGFVAVALISAVSAGYFTRMLTAHVLEQDATVMTELVNAVIRQSSGREAPDRILDVDDTQKIEPFFAQLSRVPGIIRANVYSRDERVLWSSNPTLVNRHFGHNDELEVALTGMPVSNLSGEDEHEKDEHTELPHSAQRFVEYYLPIWRMEAHSRDVIAVAEIYRVPLDLLSAIDRITRSVWISSLLGGLFLFICLFWIVKRASNVMAMQDAQLADSRRLATIGEMASTVAHSLRNPLSNIRSSAELARENGNCADTNESLDQIMRETDMMESWVRQYLGSMSAAGDASEPCSLEAVIDESIQGLLSHPMAENVRFVRDNASGETNVKFNRVVLLQIITGLLSNALEARPRDGKISVRVDPARGVDQVALKIEDHGVGISPENRSKLFSPFFTTKPNGLGIGLALTKQILERHRGKIEINSDSDHGTVVTVLLPAA